MPQFGFVRSPLFSGIIAGLTAMTLAGCATTGSSGGSMTSGSSNGCPSISRVAELSSLTQFVNPEKPGDGARVSEVHVTRVTTTCDRERGALKLDMTLNFEGALGPKGRIHAGDKPSFSYPYFIAVTNTQNQILSKEVFAVNFAYDNKSNLQVQTEEITQMIPLAGASPADMRIMVGFQLSNEELTYNRKLPASELGKSLTMVIKK
jgi:hypothetical protein